MNHVQLITRWAEFEAKHADVATKIKGLILPVCEFLRERAIEEQVSLFPQAAECRELRQLLALHGAQLGIADTDISRVVWIMSACYYVVAKAESGRR